MRWKTITWMITIALSLTMTTGFGSGIDKNTVSASTYDDFSYELINGDTAVMITGCHSSSGMITIPGTIDGRPVTSIGPYAFVYSYYLFSVTIPDSVTSIGASAFAGNFLSSVTLPDKVTYIGAGAFQGCSMLYSINVPDGVKSIEKDLFKSCSYLDDIVIPGSVTTIDDGAFESCKNLSSITLGRNVTVIGNGVFSNCSQLASILFKGDAPSTGDGWAFNCSEGLIVYYYAGSSGFTTPTWNGVQAQELALEPPSSPIGLNARTGDGEVTLTWAAPLTDGGAEIDHYILFQDGLGIGTFTETTATITNLTNGRPYSFSISAHNSVGIGTGSSEVTVTPSNDAGIPWMVIGMIAASAMIILFVMVLLVMRRKGQGPTYGSKDGEVTRGPKAQGSQMLPGQCPYCGTRYSGDEYCSGCGIKYR